MRGNSPRSLFVVLCLSSAVGFLLYWAMFMTVLPRLMKPPAFTALPLMSAVIGIISCALLYLGFNEIITSWRSKPKPRETLVLRRGEGGRVVSIGWAEESHVMKTKVPKENETNPVQEKPKARTRVKAKHVVGAAVMTALVLGGYVSGMAVMGYTVQDVARGMYSPFMTVSSQSMQPVLNYGDLILVRREFAEQIEAGDIIAFNVPSPYDKFAPSPTVHRVVEKLTENGETYLKTSGDNNSGEDPWDVPGENVIGRCVGKVPYLGLVVLFVRSPFGLALIAILIALSLLYPQARKRKGGGGEA